MRGRVFAYAERNAIALLLIVFLALVHGLFFKPKPTFNHRQVS